MQVVRVALAVLVSKSHWWTPSFILPDIPTTKSNERPGAGQGSRRVTDASQDRDTAICSHQGGRRPFVFRVSTLQCSKTDAAHPISPLQTRRTTDRCHRGTRMLDAPGCRPVAS